MTNFWSNAIISLILQESSEILTPNYTLPGPNVWLKTTSSYSQMLTILSTDNNNITILIALVIIIYNGLYVLVLDK